MCRAGGIRKGRWCEARPHGRIVRVPLERDRRIFTPLARSSQSWTKHYARRTAVERENSRLDRVYGFEEHFIRGRARKNVQVGLALATLFVMAIRHRYRR